ncbi:MAG: RNA methyltransferase [Bryobacteraceae bacterium]
MVVAETITSPANTLLKEVRKALAHGGRTPGGFCVAESFHLLDEALSSQCEVRAIIAAERTQTAVEARVQGLSGFRLVILPDKLFDTIAATEATQGVLVLVRPPEWSFGEMLRRETPIVLLDGIQDPGNAGTILRTAEAFGAAGAIFLKGAVSPYNPKAVRAAAGSLFRLPFLDGMEADETLALLDDSHVPLYAAIPSGGTPLDKARLTGRWAFVVGSEGQGVSRLLMERTIGLSIPTAGVESLNAAVAASVILYEAWRQRTHLQ